MRKSDIEIRSGRPTVNVKVYGSARVNLPLELGSSGPVGGPIVTHYTDPGFTHEWLDEHESELDWTFNAACEAGWEMLQGYAVEIFGAGVKVYSEGRSGGWAVVHGLSDPESWDAIAIARWAKFCKWAKAEVDDIPRAMIDLAYINVYEPMQETSERTETYTMGRVYAQVRS